MRVDYGLRLSMGGGRFFLVLLKKSRNEPVETYFQILPLLSHVSQVGVTYEGVTPVHMAQLTST
jgi:hypothetical protein